MSNDKPHSEHLRRSPQNLRRLLESLASAMSGEGEETTPEALAKKLGITLPEQADGDHLP